MFRWALIFLVVAMLAGALGFTGVAGASFEFAKILFWLFIVIFLIALVVGLVKRPSV